MEPPLTPPRQTQSSIQQQHQHEQDARNYASPPKTPRWRSYPQTDRSQQDASTYTSPPKTPRWRSGPSTPMANISRKRGRDSWTPLTPMSLPRRKRNQISPGLYEERAAEARDDFADKNGPENCQSVEATEEPVVGRSLVEEKPLYLAHVIFWDEDIIGVHCPFCLSTEYHLMRPPVNAEGPSSNPIWQKDMRAADCQPEMRFRLLFPFDHLAMKSLRWQWVHANSRWETTGLEYIFAKEVKKSNPVEENDTVEKSNTVEKEEATTGEDLKHQSCSNSTQDLEDMTKDHISISSDDTVSIAAYSDLDLSIAFSNDDGNETSPNEDNHVLEVGSSLFNNPHPEYVTLVHGRQTAIVYKPVAVIPVIGSRRKTLGFLAPTASSTRRVFTRSGWTGGAISDMEMAWLQGASMEAPWQELSIISNREYTDKVRKMSTNLGLEAKYHNYDKGYPLGQVYFSHVEKQLVVVALEEHQSSKHPSHSETLINRTIYLDRAPCTSCLDFAKAVERTTPLRFEFNVMARVMTREQLQVKIRQMGKGGKGTEMDDSADGSADGSSDESADDEIPFGDHRRQRSSSSKRLRMNKERQAAGEEIEGVYGILDIIDKQVLYGQLEYLVRWKRTWLTGAQLETQLNGQYADEFDVVRARNGKNGEKRYLVEWDDGWVSSRDLGNSRKLIEEYERKRALLE
ncbi:hypothetical protein O988_03570 [Pseudogymnoascus sp. VKM F-3808]|nr:hypothetical protein O988_03570 [Pseudogymnoascus sp. VKM F-3808]